MIGSRYRSRASSTAVSRRRATGEIALVGRADLVDWEGRQDLALLPSDRESRGPIRRLPPRAGGLGLRSRRAGGHLRGLRPRDCASARGGTVRDHIRAATGWWLAGKLPAGEWVTSTGTAPVRQGGENGSRRGGLMKGSRNSPSGRPRCWPAPRAAPAPTVAPSVYVPTRRPRRWRRSAWSRPRQGLRLSEAPPLERHCVPVPGRWALCRTATPSGWRDTGSITTPTAGTGSTVTGDEVGAARERRPRPGAIKPGSDHERAVKPAPRASVCRPARPGSRRAAQVPAPPWLFRTASKWS
jgi:hypothetical protein